MTRTHLTAVAAGLLALSSTSAFAACDIGTQTKYSDQDRSLSFSVRQDLRELRSAAFILNERGRDQACQQIVAAINDIRKNPTPDSSASTTAQRSTLSDTKNKESRESTAGTMARAEADWSEETAALRSKAQPVTTSEGRVSASKLIGSDLIGKDNDSIAEIEDVVVSPNGKDSYIVIGYGGFLGLGETQTAVPLDHVKVAYNNDNDPVFFLPMNQEELSKAPNFKRGSIDWMSDANWRQKNDKYFNDMSKS